MAVATKPMRYTGWELEQQPLDYGTPVAWTMRIRCKFGIDALMSPGIMPRAEMEYYVGSKLHVKHLVRKAIVLPTSQGD